MGSGATDGAAVGAAALEMVRDTVGWSGLLRVIDELEISADEVEAKINEVCVRMALNCDSTAGVLVAEVVSLTVLSEVNESDTLLTLPEGKLTVIELDEALAEPLAVTLAELTPEASIEPLDDAPDACDDETSTEEDGPLEGADVTPDTVEDATLDGGGACDELEISPPLVDVGAFVSPEEVASADEAASDVEEVKIGGIDNGIDKVGMLESVVGEADAWVVSGADTGFEVEGADCTTVSEVVVAGAEEAVSLVKMGGMESGSDRMGVFDVADVTGASDAEAAAEVGGASLVGALGESEVELGASEVGATDVGASVGVSLVELGMRILERSEVNWPTPDPSTEVIGSRIPPGELLVTGAAVIVLEGAEVESVDDGVVEDKSVDDDVAAAESVDVDEDESVEDAAVESVADTAEAESVGVAETPSVDAAADESVALASAVVEDAGTKVVVGSPSIVSSKPPAPPNTPPKPSSPNERQIDQYTAKYQ